MTHDDGSDRNDQRPAQPTRPDPDAQAPAEGEPTRLESEGGADPPRSGRGAGSAPTRLESTASDPAPRNGGGYGGLLHLPEALAERLEIVRELGTSGAEADMLLVRQRSDGELRVVKLYHV